MTILLAIVAGGALGFVLARGDFCFHSTWRRLSARPAETSLMRAYVVLLLVSTPIVQVFVATDVIDPFIPDFAPAAAIIGGLVFGVGMVIAQTCVSGMFYKFGAGMVGMLVAMAGWAVGDVLTWRGPLKSVRERLNENPVRITTDTGAEEVATVTSSMGVFGVVLLVLVGIGLALWVARDEAVAEHHPASGQAAAARLVGVKLGLAAAWVFTLAWLLVRWHGFDYSYGTSSVPTQIWNAVVDRADISWWIPLGLISVVPGALIAAVAANTLWVRGEQTRRYVELGVGGLVMGIGAAIAGGCNLGHSMVGVPLLSIGSIVTTGAIAAGVFVASRVAQ